MKKAIVLLAQGFEEVEAVTPIDFLRRADIEVTTLGLGSTQVTGNHHISVLADATVEGYSGELADVIVIPGGQPGASNLAASEEVSALITRHAERGCYVAAICAAPAAVLAPLGLLRNKKFTGFPGTESSVRDGRFIAERCVIDGNLITARAAGVSAEFSEAIITLLAGPEKAKEVHDRTLQKD